jgi:hypothetical protein
VLYSSLRLLFTKRLDLSLPEFAGILPRGLFFCAVDPTGMVSVARPAEIIVGQVVRMFSAKAVIFGNYLPPVIIVVCWS